MITYCLFYVYDIMIWITRSLDMHSDNISLYSHHRPISVTVSEISAISIENHQFSQPPCIKRPREAVPLGIWYRRKGSRITI